MAAAAQARTQTPPKSRRKTKPVEYNILLTATLCLLAAGAVMVYSASSARTLLENGGDGTGYLVKYVIYGAIGLVVLQLLARGGLEMLPKLTPALLGISFVLLVAVKVPGIGVTINGAQRWIGAGPVQFQPSELMKLALVLHAAGVLATQPRRLQTMHAVIRPLLIVAAMATVLIASQPDLGTALVITFTLGSLLLVAGTPVSLLGKIALSVLVLVVLFALIDPERVSRLTAFVNPWGDPHDTGFQAVQGQIALGSGGLFGVGLGESVQKVFYLPEAHTDFILAVIGEELGVAGVFGLLFLYGMIGYAGLRTAKSAAHALPAAARGGADGAHPLPGAAERLRRARHRPADRRAAAVHLVGLEQPARPAGDDGPAAEHRRAQHEPPDRAAPADRRAGRCARITPP